MVELSFKCKTKKYFLYKTSLKNSKNSKFLSWIQRPGKGTVWKRHIKKNSRAIGVIQISEKQISYAAQDTEYLFEIKNKLLKMLIREKRQHLFEKCLKVVPILVDIEISGFKLNVFEH